MSPRCRGGLPLCHPAHCVPSCSRGRPTGVGRPRGERRLVDCLRVPRIGPRCTTGPPHHWGAAARLPGTWRGFPRRCWLTEVGQRQGSYLPQAASENSLRHRGVRPPGTSTGPRPTRHASCRCPAALRMSCMEQRRWAWVGVKSRPGWRFAGVLSARPLQDWPEEKSANCGRFVYPRGHSGPDWRIVATSTSTDRKRPFHDREKAREAGRKGGLARADRRRQEQAALEDLPEPEEGVARDGMAVAGGVASAQARAVVAKLQAKAQAGDVAAARELREWLRLDPAREAGRDALRLALLVAQLTTVQRRALHDWLIEQLSPANGNNREGSNEVEQLAPSPAVDRKAEAHPPQPRDSEPTRAAEPQSASPVPEPQPETL